METDPRFPIGPFKAPETITPEMRTTAIDELAHAPGRYREAVRGLSDAQLDTPYRTGGWTIRQVVHHVADSHMQSLSRFKLALTENEPVIKPYNEADWAQLADSAMPVDASLDLIDAMHRRWVVLLASMDDAAFARTFYHPERKQAMRLDVTLLIYAWHSRHHLAHIQNTPGVGQAA